MLAARFRCRDPSVNRRLSATWSATSTRANRSSLEALAQGVLVASAFISRSGTRDTTTTSGRRRCPGARPITANTVKTGSRNQTVSRSRQRWTSVLPGAWLHIISLSAAGLCYEILRTKKGSSSSCHEVRLFWFFGAILRRSHTSGSGSLRILLQRLHCPNQDSPPGLAGPTYCGCRPVSRRLHPLATFWAQRPNNKCTCEPADGCSTGSRGITRNDYHRRYPGRPQI